jgi:hypothetical protein
MRFARFERMANFAPVRRGVGGNSVRSTSSKSAPIKSGMCRKRPRFRIGQPDPEILSHQVDTQRRFVQQRFELRARFVPYAVLNCRAVSTRASSSFALKGFTRYSSAPAAMPSMRLSIAVQRADSKITGYRRKKGSARNALEQSVAVQLGIITSERMRAGG